MVTLIIWLMSVQGFLPFATEEANASVVATDGSYFTFDAAAGMITGYASYGPTDVVIPSQIDGVDVRIIGSQAFYPNRISNPLTSVVIPDTVTSIRDRAFSTNDLETITLGKGLQLIEYQAFAHNHLTSVVIPDSVTTIGIQAFFKNNTLSTVTLGSSLKTIGNFAFEYNQLNAVTVSQGVTSIGSRAFGDHATPFTASVPDSLTTFGTAMFGTSNAATIRGCPSFEALKDYTETYSMYTFENDDALCIPVETETPVIHTGPADVVSAVYEAIEVSVSASVEDGGTLSYQWYASDSDSTTGGTAIEEADEANYEPPTNTSGTTYYYVVVTNTKDDPVGGNVTASVTSDAAAVKVNARPFAEDASVNVNEDQVYRLETDDFHFGDADGDTLERVRLVTVPVAGILFTDVNDNDLVDDGETMSNADEASKEALDLGKIKYVATADASDLTFEVHDGMHYSAATYTLSFAVNTRPSVAITSVPTGASNASPVEVTVTFSEPVSGFSEGDANVANGEVAAGSLAGSGAVYTLQIVPSAEGEVDVQIGAGAAADNGGAENKASSLYTFVYDITAPNEPAITASTADLTDRDVTITITYPTDAATRSVKLGDGSWQPYTNAIDVAYNQTVYARAVDAAGNVSTVYSYVISNIDKDEPFIILTGQAELNHEAATAYSDAGAFAQDNRDGDLTADITVTGSVYTGQLGTYVLRYNVSDSMGHAALEVSRTVHVVDTTAPTVALHGDAVILLPLGDPFIDPGAAASDSYEGDLSSDMTVSGSVYENAPGVYTLTYRVADTSGNTGEATRTVTVYDHEQPTIVLQGNTDLTLEAGSAFVEPGFTAWDEQDGDLTREVTVTGAVYNDKPGLYSLRYNVKDRAGNAAAEATRTIEVVYRDTSDSEPEIRGEAAPSDSNAVGVEIWINGKAEQIGTAVASSLNGQSVITVTVDETMLNERLEAEGQGAVITIPVSAGSDKNVGKLNGLMVKHMETKQATIELRTDRATYTLPVRQIDIDALAQRFGAELALQDIAVHVEIAAPSSERMTQVGEAAERASLTPIAPPLDFRVYATHGDKTEEVSRFNAYVQRTVALPEGIDPNRITTGVVVEPDGAVRHIPTKVTQVDQRYYAEINSLTNSTYSVVWHPLSFADMANHWARDTVNNMGSRLVVEGTGQDLFSPDRVITRAEFATILVRGLGLRFEEDATPFADLVEDTWYFQAVQTAHAYGLVNGYEDGTFRPHAEITREQAMLMIAHAMKLTGLYETLPRSTDGALDAYPDTGDIAPWSIGGVAESVRAGIVSGRSGGVLAPGALMTRAEVAVVVERLLIASGLI
ncbi:DUF5011 domain-containing protein [Paenibacillus sp. TRM 82003]|nr:DUF5011 domain-containing protein [Paenibacillus sp. TRM 82003]